MLFFEKFFVMHICAPVQTCQPFMRHLFQNVLYVIVRKCTISKEAYTKLSATADINSLIVITDFQKKVGEPVFIILISI